MFLWGGFASLRARFGVGCDVTVGIEAADRPRELLRLWTVKEALFKANPGNRDTMLGQYLLADPSALAGSAGWRGEQGTPYRYASVAALGGFLTVAVRKERE